MAQVSITFNIDSDLKASFCSICSKLGMSANTAMNIFIKEVVQRGKIPSEILSDKTLRTTEGQRAFRAIRALAESGEFPEMTLDEINKEIECSRTEWKRNRQ